MAPAVKVVLAGVFSASLQHGRLWRHVVFVAPKRARRLVFFQAEAVPTAGGIPGSRSASFNGVNPSPMLEQGRRFIFQPLVNEIVVNRKKR